MFDDFGILEWGLAALLYFAVFLVPLFTAARDRRMARRPYALRSLAAVLIITASVGLAYALGWDAFWVGMGVGGLVGFAWLYWSLYRLQDVGWPRQLMVLLLIPVCSEILWFLLLITRARDEREASMPSESAVGA